MKPVLLKSSAPNVRTLLVLGRVSNLPSVWTNGSLGFALAYFAETGKLPGWSAVAILLPFLTGCSLLYIFGMYANDWMDASWDQENGKKRPIPEGLISRGNVAIFALFFLFLGLSTTWQAGWWTLGLVASIVIYTLIHKKTALGIFPMAACRFCLVMMGGAVSGGSSLPLAAGASLAVYLLLLTWIARNEHKFGKIRLVGWLLAGICLHDAIWASIFLSLSWVLAFLCAFALCRILQKSVPAS